MVSIAIFLAALSLVLVSRLIARRFRWGHFLGGLLFGVYTEINFEACWSYDPIIGLLIWRDVSLTIVIGWGALCMLALAVSDRWSSRGEQRLEASLLVTDMILFAGLGFACERLFASRGLWQYNTDIQAITAVQLMGYLQMGVLVPSVGRRIERCLSAATVTKDEPSQSSG